MESRITAGLLPQSVILFGLVLAMSTAWALEPKEMVGQAGIYTLTNLHADSKRNQVSSANYLLPKVIKVCSEVKIEKIGRKKMAFSVVESGRKYDYVYHAKATPEGFEDNILKYFGPSCPQAKLNSMGETDKKGIKRGKAIRGMSREAVILAIGYPPEHRTPDLEYDEWIYWMNKWRARTVTFDDNGKIDVGTP